MAEKEEEKQKKHWITAEMDLAPIWDGRDELKRLSGMVALITFLLNPNRPKDEDADFLMGMFFEPLMDLEERIDKVADDLNEAINNMKIKQERPGGQESAPAAVTAAAGA